MAGRHLPSNEDSLRQAVAKELGWSEVPGWMLKMLQEQAEDYLDSLEFGDEERVEVDWDRLVDAARCLRDGFVEAQGWDPASVIRSDRPVEHRGRAQPVQIDPSLDSRERLRLFAMSEYVAGEAARAPEVVSFRQEILGGALLMPEQALAFVTSPAALRFTRSDFRNWSIPFVYHDAVLVEPVSREQEGDVVFLRASVKVDPPGHTYCVRLGNTRRFHLETLQLPGYARKQHSVEAWPGSVVDELRMLSVELARDYDWDVGYAALFVLSGVTPLVLAMRREIQFKFGSFVQPAIVLRVAPWLAADKVKQVYQHMQREVLGQDNRPFSAERLELFRFVTVRRASGGRPPKWRELMKAWNHLHVDRTYTDANDFQDSYNRIRDSLMYPGLTRARKRERQLKKERGEE